MMKKLHTLIIAIVVVTCADLLQAMFCCQSEAVTDLSAAQQGEISVTDNSSKRYIDWNVPALSAAGAEFSPARNQQTSGTERYQSQVRDSGGVKTGKATWLSTVTELESIMDLFPSGTKSKSHNFIILRKLQI